MCAVRRPQEERAMKAPIKIFPTVLFIFPAMFLIIPWAPPS